MAGYGYTPRPYGSGVAPRAKRITPVRPNDRGGLLGAAPAFPSLTGATAAKPKAPSYTQAQVDASLKQNPQASSGGYMGPAMQPQVPAPGPITQPSIGYDYNADPILNSLTALDARSRADAQSGALSARKQLAIDFGDEGLAGTLNDPNTLAAALANPSSVKAQLKRSYETGTRNLDEQLNDQNLFYSGARINQQGEATRGYQDQLAAAASQQQGLLGQINQEELAALLAADTGDVNARGDAEQRARDWAVEHGTDPGADAAGPRILEGPAPPPAGAEASGAAIGGALGPRVGATTDPLIAALLGRKQDPRYFG